VQKAGVLTKEEQQAIDSQRINSTNDLHYKAHGPAFQIQTKPSQLYGQGRKSENDTSQRNLRKRIRSTHTTRAESGKQVPEMRRNTGYESQATGTYARMRKPTNLSQG
jgi:hypothetical protein